MFRYGCIDVIYKKASLHPEVRKALYCFNFQCSIVNHLHTPSLPATFTQSNNNNVANQVQRLHFSVFFRLSAAKVHISLETTKQFVTFLVFCQKINVGTSG